MTTNSLPKNSQAILNAIVESDNPVHFLCDRFASASPKEDEELRGIIRELSQDGFINVKWADNLPYYITTANDQSTQAPTYYKFSEFSSKDSLLVAEPKTKYGDDKENN